jgi:hypothetical protein
MLLSHQHGIEERNRDHRIKSRNKHRPDRRGLEEQETYNGISRISVFPFQ